MAITSPIETASFSAPADITVTANASDDGTISKVEFFANGALIGTDSTVPFSVDWTAVPGGAYGLTAKATDNAAYSTDLIVRDDGAEYTVEPFAYDTWYKFWVVVDNANDVWSLYMQGGDNATPTLIDGDDNGSTSFAFRNGPSSNDLTRFVIWTQAHSGPFWLDDIYLAPGEDLSDGRLRHRA